MPSSWKALLLGRDRHDVPPRMLVAAGVVAWVLGSVLAFSDRGDGPATGFVGAGLVLFLVAAYFDRIEEAGMSGVKIGPNVKSLPPNADPDYELSPTADEQAVDPPEELQPPPDQEIHSPSDEIQTFDRLDDVPLPALAALLGAVPELRHTPGGEFVKARRKRGRGNNPWLFEFRLADGSTRVWRVSWGGQGKRSATVRS